MSMLPFKKDHSDGVEGTLSVRQLCHRELWLRDIMVAEEACSAGLPTSREGAPSFLSLLWLPVWEYRCVKRGSVQPSPPMTALVSSSLKLWLSPECWQSVAPKHRHFLYLGLLEG